jgi:hypothetical protein
MVRKFRNPIPENVEPFSENPENVSPGKSQKSSIHRNSEIHEGNSGGLPAAVCTRGAIPFGVFRNKFIDLFQIQNVRTVSCDEFSKIPQVGGFRVFRGFTAVTYKICKNQSILGVSGTVPDFKSRDSEIREHFVHSGNFRISKSPTNIPVPQKPLCAAEF